MFNWRWRELLAGWFGRRPSRPPAATCVQEVSEEEFVSWAAAAGFDDKVIRNMVDYSIFQATAYEIGGKWLRISGKQYH